MRSPSDELVFVVRLWVQGGDASGQGEWRGAIQDVTSGQRFYVAGTRDIADFIDARMSERGKPVR